MTSSSVFPGKKYNYFFLLRRVYTMATKNSRVELYLHFLNCWKITGSLFVEILQLFLNFRTLMGDNSFIMGLCNPEWGERALLKWDLCKISD